MPIQPDIYAIELLKNDKVVALPTETVYGLAANATSDKAVLEIYRVKQRPPINPLIIHCRNKEQALDYIIPNQRFEILVKTFCPGPLTLICPLKQNHKLSQYVTSGLKTVAVRIPAHPKFQKFLNAVNFPLAAPSANKSGTLSPTQAKHVLNSFDQKVDVIDGGACQLGLESTILDISENDSYYLRPGIITKEILESIIGPIKILSQPSKPRSPGQLFKHYAPLHPIILGKTQVNPEDGLLAFGNTIPDHSGPTLNLSPKEDLEEAAQNLFSMLHELDQMSIKRIVIMPIPNVNIGKAINERLLKAAS